MKELFSAYASPYACLPQLGLVWKLDIGIDNAG